MWKIKRHTGSLFLCSILWFNWNTHKYNRKQHLFARVLCFCSIKLMRDLISHWLWWFKVDITLTLMILPLRICLCSHGPSFFRLLLLPSSYYWATGRMALRHGWVWFDQRVHLVGSSLQSISLNSFAWEQTNCQCSVVIHTWSWRGKPAASARAWLREANNES